MYYNIQEAKDNTWKMSNIKTAFLSWVFKSKNWGKKTG